MHKLIFGLIAGAAILTLGTNSAHARPDRPSVGIVYGSSDDGLLHVFSISEEDVGLQFGAQMICGVTTPNYVAALQAIMIEPDSLKYGKSSLKAKQSAYLQMQVQYGDPNSPVDPVNYSSQAVVAGCKASFAMADKDGDLDFIDGEDIGGFSIQCDPQALTDLGMSPTDAQNVITAFGGKVKCSAKGVALTVGCFRGDTIVSTEHGDRAIRDIRIGDRVWSFDEKSGKQRLAKVTQTFVRPAQRMRTLAVGSETLRLTDSHPLMVEGKGWTQASKVSAGDVVRTSDDRRLVVKSNDRSSEETFFAGYDRSQDRNRRSQSAGFSIQHVSFGKNASEGMVYNIEVDGTHTYFVGKQKVLVHNK